MSRYHIPCQERAADGGIAVAGVILNGLRRATGNAFAEYGRRSGSSLKDPAHDSVYRVGVLCTKPGGTAGLIFQPVPAETAIGTGFFVR